MKENNTNLKIKIFTYIDRVNILSDIFIKYYTKFFTHNEFHFLILNKNYDSVSGYLKLNNFSENSFEMVENNHIGVPVLLPKQNELLNELISNGFIVVCVDIDEILFHHDLRNYILNSHQNYLTPKGIVIIPDQSENPIDSEKNILLQRKYCVMDDEFHSKVCVLKSKYEWSGGRHNKNSNPILDDIFLIDISKSCPKIMIENNIISNELYSKLTDRYSVMDKNFIDNILNRWRTRITTIPNYILKNNLF